MRTPHYLPALRTTRIPAYHAIFDCETRTGKEHGKYAHKWVCGAFCYGELDANDQWFHSNPQALDSPQELWSEITANHLVDTTLVIWAHNLSFDLRVSEALRWLPVEGYALEAIVLEKTAAWASFKGPRGKLTLCDLHSWLPVPLNVLAADMGRGRPRVNYNVASDALLALHCRNDVDVTAEAVGKVVEWLKQNGAGSFRPTGSGQSHAMWRRRFMPEKTVLVHGDEHALERERVAMWAGRVEAWRWGEVKGPLYEHDLNLAYCRIAATSEVPVKLIDHCGARSAEWFNREVRQCAILADVTVRTDMPLVPTGRDGRMYWPVGEFQTTLWSPEIELLLREGADVTIHRAWRYRTEPALAPMANYIIDLLGKQDGDPPRIVQRMLKHWARTLVGRCALRYREWDDFGSVSGMGLSLSSMFDSDTGSVTDLLQVGRRIFELTEMAESDSSVPQITGWVMSKARANLWEVASAAGLENVYYMDTDCVLVDGHGDRQLEIAAIETPGLRLVAKGQYKSARINGPRNIVLEGERRISGVPKKAVQRGEMIYDGEVWAGLRSSLETNRPSSVGITPREFEVDDVDPRRERIEGGVTIPFRMEPHATK